MSPKPKSDPDETLDTFLNKLANLQTQLLTTQDHDGRYITLQQAFELINRLWKPSTTPSTMRSLLYYPPYLLILLPQYHPTIYLLTLFSMSIGTTSSTPPQFPIFSRPFLLQQEPPPFHLFTLLHHQYLPLSIHQKSRCFFFMEQIP